MNEETLIQMLAISIYTTHYHGKSLAHHTKERAQSFLNACKEAEQIVKDAAALEAAEEPRETPPEALKPVEN